MESDAWRSQIIGRAGEAIEIVFVGDYRRQSRGDHVAMRQAVEVAEHDDRRFDSAAAQLHALFDQRNGKTPHFSLESTSTGDRAMPVRVGLDDREKCRQIRLLPPARHRRSCAARQDRSPPRVGRMSVRMSNTW